MGLFELRGDPGWPPVKMVACLKDAAPDVRLAAAQAMEYTGGASVLAGYGNLLRDSNLQLRTIAVRVIGSHKDDRLQSVSVARPEIVAALKDPDRGVRSIAA